MATENSNPPPNTRVDRVLNGVLVFLFVMMVAATIVQVVVRLLSLQISGIPFYLTGPIATVGLLFGTYLGAAVATRQDEHIKMSIVQDRMSGRRLATMRVVASLVVVVTLVIFIFGSLQSASKDWNSQFGGVDFIQTGILYLSIAVSLAVMLMFEILNTIGTIRGGGASSDE